MKNRDEKNNNSYFRFGFSFCSGFPSTKIKN